MIVSKRFCLLLILILWNLNSNAQGCWPDQTPEFWKIGDQYGSKLLSACHSGAYYNCHGYVISHFENNCTEPNWMAPPIQAPYTCPNLIGVEIKEAYQTSIKYVKVCTESAGEIIYYDFQGDGHSAIKKVIGGGEIKYFSKYGSDGPLVGHNRDGSFYHYQGQQDNSPDYWVFIGGVTGNTTINGTGLATFSVLQKPEVSYSWSIVSGGTNIYITSGANQNAVSLQPTHSGNAVLRLTTSSNCATPKTKDIALTIQTGICLEGTYDNVGVYNKNLYTTNNVSVGGVGVHVSCASATTITWQKTSGNINGFFPPGNSISFSMTSGGSISFLITAKSGSTTIATRNVAFYNYGSYMIYPNPSDDELTIDLNPELVFDVTLTPLDGSSEPLTLNQYSGAKKIDTSKLKKGEYSLSIFHEGKMINQQHVRINR